MIESLQNDTVKFVLSLYKKSTRDDTGLFIIEGAREVQRALAAGVVIETIFVCDELLRDGGWIGQLMNDSVGKVADSRVKSCTQVSRRVFEKMSYREGPDGVLAVAKQPRLGLPDLERIIKNKLGQAASMVMGPGLTLVVAESIEKPGNLGAILRSADATGVDAVVLCDPRTDLWNPNVVHASTGMVFVLPVIEAATDETLALLKRYGVAVIATTPSATRLYTEIDLTGPVAIAVGTEHEGLTDKWLRGEQVKIPMLGKADSLNVATATAVMLYELIRQRGSSK